MYLLVLCVNVLSYVELLFVSLCMLSLFLLLRLLELFCDGDESWLFVFKGLCFWFGVFVLLYFLDLSIVIVYSVLYVSVCLFRYGMLVIVLGRDFVFFLTPTCYGIELLKRSILHSSTT